MDIVLPYVDLFFYDIFYKTANVYMAGISYMIRIALSYIFAHNMDMESVHNTLEDRIPYNN